MSQPQTTVRERPAATSGASHRAPAPASATGRAAAVALLVVAGAHAPLIAEHLEEAPYVGVLFALLTATCVVLAGLLLVRPHRAAWALAGSVCLAALMAFLASRTVGLPQLGDDVGNWTEALGYPALAGELVVVGLSVVRLRAARSGR